MSAFSGPVSAIISLNWDLSSLKRFLGLEKELMEVCVVDVQMCEGAQGMKERTKGRKGEMWRHELNSKKANSCCYVSNSLAIPWSSTRILSESMMVLRR